MVELEKLKLYGNRAALCLTFFLIGLDQSIHWSGMYDYFMSVGADSSFYSYGVAVFSMGEMISNPIWGKLFDSFHSAKLFTVIRNGGLYK